MLSKYLTITLRIFKRDKAYSLLNIAGLTAGVTASLMLFAYSFNESQYDMHHEKKDRIVRVVMDVKFGDEARAVAVVPAALGFYMQQQAIGVEAYAMLRPIAHPGFQVKKGDDLVAEHGLYYASQGVLDVFTWQWLAGDRPTALTPHNTIVLTRSLAVKYFGSVDKAVGEVITRDNGSQYSVTGVIEDVSQKGHFNPRGFVSLWDGSKTSNWRDWNWTTYLLLQEGKRAVSLLPVLQQAFEKNLAPRLAESGGGAITFCVQNLTDIYFDSRLDFEMEPNEGSRVFIRGFAIVGTFLLLLAIINYINLVTAQAEKRGREVGVKKAFGVTNGALRMQFMLEAFFYVAVSVVSSFFLLILFQPAFFYFTGDHLPFSMLLSWSGCGIILCFIVLIAVLSGAYPAFFISSFKAFPLLKQGMLIRKPKGGFSLRRMLVIVQLTVSLSMIVGIPGIYMQLRFMNQYSLGFSKDKVLKFSLPNAAVSNYKPLKEALLANPFIAGVASATELPGEKPAVNDFNYETAEGIRREILQQMWVDEGFSATLNIPLLAGSNFGARVRGDSALPGVLVNRAFVDHAGWKMDEAVGKTLNSHDWSDKVIGVIENFHVVSLHDKIEPMVLRNTASGTNMVVRFTGSLEQALEAVQKAADKVSGQGLAAWSFLEADFQKQYEKDEKRADLLAVFATVVLFIACMGMLGISAYDVRQQKKEIGIRKILGAPTSTLLLHLSRPYLRLIAVASLLAIPVANYLLTEWLQTFVYRIEMVWWMLALPVVVLLFIAMGVVSLQTVRAAGSNPVEVLRYE